MGPARAELAAAVAEAWDVLDLPPPPSTGVCKGCCMDPDIEAAFLGFEARDLPLSHVRDWYFAAYADDLGYAQMGWLLPRVMELLAAGEEPSFFGLETTLARLPQAGFPGDWPEPAVRAVRRFAHAWLATVVEERRPDLDESLCMIGAAGLDIGPFLHQLDALEDGALAACLHAYWVEHGCGRVWLTAFWTETAGRGRVWAWYLSESLEDRMTRAGLAGDDRAAAVSDVIARAVREYGR